MADPRALTAALAKSPDPWEIECIPSIDSTNLELSRRYGKAGDAPRLVLWAEEQTTGKGRLKRRWFSVPEADITASVCFPSPVSRGDVPKLSLAAGLALVSVLREDYDVSGKVRWPNDVLTERGKLAGILSSYLSVPDAVICGIGINVNSDPEEFSLGEHSRRTTMRAELGRDIPREPLLGAWLLAFEEIWPLAREERIDDLRAVFDPLSFYRGKRVRVLIGAAELPDEDLAGEELEGIAGSLDSDGALLVLPPDGTPYSVNIDDVLIPLD